jgi:hypothetical protein
MTDTTPADDGKRTYAYWDWKTRAKCFGEREAFDAGWQARAASQPDRVSEYLEAQAAFDRGYKAGKEDVASQPAQLTNAEIDWRQQYHGIVDAPVQPAQEPVERESGKVAMCGNKADPFVNDGEEYELAEGWEWKPAVRATYLLDAAPPATQQRAEPAAIVDLSTSEPRLAQMAATLTHGQELYAPPLSDQARQDRIMELADAMVEASYMAHDTIGKPTRLQLARAALEREVRKPA